MRKLIISFLTAISCYSCQSLDQDKHLLNDISPDLTDHWVNIVVEIPSGTNEKWEVNKESGLIERDSINGEPRTIQYLSYPGNYGFIPQTLLTKKDGGDGDPLDILVIGDAQERGSIIRCKVLGMLQLLDNSEQDDKLIAIAQNSNLQHINDLKELESLFPGVLLILETWFVNYKGNGIVQSKGFKDSHTALALIKVSHHSFLKSN